jgi:hypothetical protein
MPPVTQHYTPTSDPQALKPPSIKVCEVPAFDDPNFYIVAMGPICDDPKAVPPNATPKQRAQAYAVNYLRSLTMPTPSPKISAPNGGICGAVHSLELGMNASMSYTDPDTPFGPLVVRVTGSFVVNWGDGKSNTYSTTGKAWPNSEIQHSWEVSSHYDIAVTANWSANWTFGEYSGVITGLTTTGAIRNWPVLEAQAVLIR